MTSESDDDAQSDSGPDWEKLNERDRISDAAWDEVVQSWDAPAAVNSEMPADIVAEHLDENDDWDRPEAPAVGWRDAPPMLVLALCASVGGIVALVVGAVMLRPIPGWLAVGLIVIILMGGAYLFRNLPNERHTGGDDGASV